MEIMDILGIMGIEEEITIINYLSLNNLIYF